MNHDCLIIIKFAYLIFKILQSAKTGFFKELGDRLRTDPLSRCAPPKQCMDLVKKGSTIYSAVIILSLFFTAYKYNF